MPSMGATVKSEKYILLRSMSTSFCRVSAAAGPWTAKMPLSSWVVMLTSFPSAFHLARWALMCVRSFSLFPAFTTK